MMRTLSSAVLLFALFLAATPAIVSAQRTLVTVADRQVPRYQYVFVIVEENKNYSKIIDGTTAPFLSSLAHSYGNATNFFAETHPSEPNYLALIAGSTFGITDDDAFYCHPRDSRPFCYNSNRPGYVDHTIVGETLGDQLEKVGLTWKVYAESIPVPGSLDAVSAKGVRYGSGAVYAYASKHVPFLNFASVQTSPNRPKLIVGFSDLYQELESGHLPNFSLVIPNMCDEMHGLWEPDAPDFCDGREEDRLIARGDQTIKLLVSRIMQSQIWTSKVNAAIVVTFDEDDDGGTAGCCGNNLSDPSNAGGGHIPTVVITNHGPRGLQDAAPYNHYSLLRTLEDSFGIHEYLRRAGAPGVKPMTPLFATH